MPESDDDFRPRRAFAQVTRHFARERRLRVLDERRQSLGVKKHHARPTHGPAPPVRRFETHHEQVALVVEEVFPVLELRERLLANPFEELQVFFAALERLLHRDHAVSEHSGLRHVTSGGMSPFIRSSASSP
jgi:hypothetical protein